MLRLALDEQQIRRERQAQGLPLRKWPVTAVPYAGSPETTPETLDLESLTFCEKIQLPLSRSAGARVDILNQRIQHLQTQHKLNKKNMKDELKEIVNEFRFGESESRSLLDSFKALLRERRRLKPVKSIKKTVQLKRQRQIKFLVSLLKASEAGFEPWRRESRSELTSKKVSKRN